MRWIALLSLPLIAACAGLPGTQTATMDGRSIAFARQGEAAPTVVFEAGLGDGMSTWSTVATQTAGFASVFAYDRPAYGGSAKTATARDGATIVGELRALLQRTGVKPPYVLVGHSLGGSTMELFARTWPSEVAGLVLVDSRHADFSRRCREAQALVCEPPALLVAAMPGGAAAEYREVEATMRQLGSAPPLRADLPLVVLTGMRKIVEGPTFRDTWLATQRDLAKQSARGEHVVCEACGHYVHKERADLVVAAIRKVVHMAREPRISSGQRNP
jgi:pimeloyl-ACP methyl ester carboxylesterase